MEYNSDYDVRLATLQKLGGDVTKKYDSVYEIDIAILDAINGGGGGGGAVIDDNNVSTGTTYSSNKIVGLLADAGFDVEIVETLPVTGDAHTIYFIASTDPLTLNTYDEFMYINGGWEQVGSTAIDLSSYAKISDVDASLALYAKKTDVNTSLADYAKIADVNSSLADYAKIADVNSSLADRPEYVEITQSEYDNLSSALKNNGSVYIITDATAVDITNYYTKSQADAAFNPYNTVTASSGSYKFPNWNARGQITGSAAQAYQASQNVNGSSRTLYSTSSSSLPTIYAPTSAGTNGQYLVSNGSGAPTWKTLEVASDYVISDADASVGTYSSQISQFYTKTISEGVVQGVQIKIVDTHTVNGLQIYTLADGDTFLVESGETATITVTDSIETTHTISIAADGTITDSDSTGCVTADTTLSITGYYAYTFSTVSDEYTFTSITGDIYETTTATSDNYYLPSSARIFLNNVELWLMYTEDGATWNNIHYLITSSTISRNVTTGTFGPNLNNYAQIQYLTQVEYSQLNPPDSSTIYIITNA